MLQRVMHMSRWLLHNECHAFCTSQVTVLAGMCPAAAERQHQGWHRHHLGSEFKKLTAAE